MLLSSASEQQVSLNLIECGLTLIAVVVAYSWPYLGSSYFSRIECVFGRLAQRKALAVAITGVSAIVLRLAILPLCPIPQPFVPDDFSFLLSADTFLHGRLTNRTPAMWVHFESFHITMTPTYTSMYFPAEGLILAAGKVLLGHPWFGLLCVSGLMCAAICWMLQAWLPPTWAFLGGILAVLRLCLFSYWINTYTGAGLISALGGALVLGSLLRFMKTPKSCYALLLAAGIILLLLTRPYEGFLLCFPAAILLIIWLFCGKNRPGFHALVRCTAVPLTMIIAAVVWMGYYDYRAFGSPLTLPYTINRQTYAVAPYYVWQAQRPEPVYRHEVMRRFYCETELINFTPLHSFSGFFPETLSKVKWCILFFTGFALLPPLLMLPRVFRDRRIRFLVVCLLMLMTGMLIQIYFLPHYVAPFTVVFYAIGLQAMRHLRIWSPGRKPVGLVIVRLIVVLCFLIPGIRLFPSFFHLKLAEWPAGQWSMVWYGPDHFGIERARIEAKLGQLSGKQLVIVRYSSEHYPLDEWVYNSSDIDGSKVIWAREMDAANNLELIHYYKDRHVWLVQPDLHPTEISPYPVPGQVMTASR